MAKRRRRYVVKDKKYTMRRIGLLLLSVLLVAGLIIASVFIFRGCGVSVTLHRLPFNSDRTFSFTGDGFLYLSPGYLDFYSIEDTGNNFERPLEGIPDNLIGTEGIKAVYSGSAIQIIDAPFNIELDGEIVSAQCGSSNIAVCKQRADGQRELRVYNKSGQQVYQQDYAAGMLTDFGFSEANGNMLWIMETSVDSCTPCTTVTMYDLNRMSTTGVISVQGQLVEDVFFTDSGVFAVGTESLIRYASSGNLEQYRLPIYGYRMVDVCLSGSSPLLLLVPRDIKTDDHYAVRLLSVSEKKVADEVALTMQLPSDTIGCYTASGLLVVVTSSSVILYDSDGELVESHSMNGIITSSQKLDDTHILVERSGELTLVTLK